MGSPKISTPATPPPAPDYADAMAKVQNRVSVKGSRRKSFITGASSSSSTAQTASAGMQAFSTKLGQ